MCLRLGYQRNICVSLIHGVETRAREKEMSTGGCLKLVHLRAVGQVLRKIILAGAHKVQFLVFEVDDSSHSGQ